MLRMSQVLRARTAGRGRDRRAVGSELRDRAGAHAADRAGRGRRIAAVVESVMAHFRIAGAAPLWQQRCRRRRARRRAQEHHRDRRRRRRRPWPRPQRAGGADHARPRRAVAAGRGARRAARHAVRAGRPRRSGADVHRRSQPQSPRRPRARAAASRSRRFWPAPGWSPKACAPPKPRWRLSAQAWHRAADRAARCRTCSSGRTDPQTAIRNLMGRKQKLEHA